MSDNARDIINALAQPFDRSKIKQVKKGRAQLDYVEGHEYITRLNAASPAWSFVMTKSDTQTLVVNRKDRESGQYVPQQLPCLVVYGELEIPGVGKRSGIGVQMLEDNAGEDALKGAMTDCLKNCAKYFGLGLHLYGAEVPEPPAADYSGDAEWQKANKRLHAVASNVISGDYHTAVTLMANKKGADSIKHLPADTLNSMAAYMEGDPEKFGEWFDRNIAPQMPATGAQQQELG